MKRIFKIAVAQLTRTHDHTFERAVDPNCPPVPIFGPILAQLCQITNTYSQWSPELVYKLLSGLDKKWAKNHASIMYEHTHEIG